MRRGYRKYGNRRVNDPVDGKFDSQGEWRRWRQLRQWEAIGLITGLRRQVRHEIKINGQRVCTYVADFEYVTRNVPGRKPGELVTEDFKGIVTAEFRIKAKLLRAVEGINVTLVTTEDLR